MSFGRLDRQDLKREAKGLLAKNIRYCIAAATALVLLSLLVQIVETLITASVPDYLGINTVADIEGLYDRMMSDPLLFRSELFHYYGHHYLYKILGHVIGVVLEAPLLLAFMAGLYHISVCGEHPSRKTLLAWYCHPGLTARSISLLFFLDVIFEVLRTILVMGPIVLMMHISLEYMATDPMAMPLWVSALPLLSLGGLVLGAFLYARWLPALHFMAKYPHLGPWGALRKSAQELKGHRWQYICLVLSFLPWLLLEAVTYGAAGLFVLPYMELTVTLFLEKIKLPKDPPLEPLPE